LRERHKRSAAKELDFTISGIIRHCVSAIYRPGQLDPITYFYIDDWRSNGNQRYITIKELTHSFTVTILSAAASGIGLGQVIYQLFGG
jgi:hypothetical protein